MGGKRVINADCHSRALSAMDFSAYLLVGKPQPIYERLYGRSIGNFAGR